MSTPAITDRYAVVSTGCYGPTVSFWSDHLTVIDLMTRYARAAWCTEQAFAVWHRRSAKARWVCITN
jgi:hypothetical protein